MDEEKICRYCFEGEEKEKLISPCLCKGSSKYVHRSCLNSWRSHGNHEKCELCHFDYRFEPNSNKLMDIYYKNYIPAVFVETIGLYIVGFLVILLIVYAAFGSIKTGLKIFCASLAAYVSLYNLYFLKNPRLIIAWIFWIVILTWVFYSHNPKYSYVPFVVYGALGSIFVTYEFAQDEINQLNIDKLIIAAVKVVRDYGEQGPTSTS